MSEMKHSPGAWEVAGKSTNEPGYGVVMDAMGFDVALTEMGGEPEITFANACLIAAAPEMFDALSLCADVLEGARDCYLVNGKRPEGGSEAAPHSEWAALVKAIKATRAAIAKAEGSQP